MISDGIDVVRGGSKRASEGSDAPSDGIEGASKGIEGASKGIETASLAAPEAATFDFHPSALIFADLRRRRRVPPLSPIATRL
jgi:hypothetical protein